MEVRKRDADTVRGQAELECGSRRGDLSRRQDRRYACSFELVSCVSATKMDVVASVSFLYSVNANSFVLRLLSQL
jgi:hypothetical protein